MSSIQDKINIAVDEMAKGPSKEVLHAVSQLALDDPNDVLPELFVEIEDAAAGVDLDNIVVTDLMPDPNETKMIVAAVQEEDVERLLKTITGGYEGLMPVLLATIVALKKSPRK